MKPETAKTVSSRKHKCKNNSQLCKIIPERTFTSCKAKTIMYNCLHTKLPNKNDSNCYLLCLESSELLLLPSFNNVSSNSTGGNVCSSWMMALGSRMSKRSGTGTDFIRCHRRGGHTMCDAFAVISPYATFNSIQQHCTCCSQKICI